MSSTTGIALLGAGIFARQAYIPAIKALGSQVKLHAIYSRSAKSASALATTAAADLGYPQQSIAVYSDDSPNATLDALLASPDISVVIIALPINTQPDIILEALKAGKHVLSEKPVANSIAAAQSLIAAYKNTYASSLHWRIAENFEVEPAFLRVRDAIRAGVIGDISFFKSTTAAYIDVENNPYYKTPWRTTPEYQGGFLLDGGVHSVALLRTILSPARLATLSAYSSLNRKELAPHDTINAIVRLSPPSSDVKAAHGIFELTFGVPLESRASGAATVSPNGTVVTGTKGWLAIRSANENGVSVYKVEIHSTANGKETTDTFTERGQGVEGGLEHFINLVSGAGDAGFGLVDGALSDVAFIESALKSNGNEIQLL